MWVIDKCKKKCFHTWYQTYVELWTNVKKKGIFSHMISKICELWTNVRKGIIPHIMLNICEWLTDFFKKRILSHRISNICKLWRNVNRKEYFHTRYQIYENYWQMYKKKKERNSKSGSVQKNLLVSWLEKVVINWGRGIWDPWKLLNDYVDDISNDKSGGDCQRQIKSNNHGEWEDFD